MSYEETIANIQNISKEQLKNAIHEIDRYSIERLDKLDIDIESKRELFKILRDRTWVDIVLVNSLK